MGQLGSIEFQVDDARSDDCLAHRGFGFAYAVRAFLDPIRFVSNDRCWGYAKERYRLLSEIEGWLFMVTYTIRDSIIRRISGRNADRKRAWNVSG